MYFGDFSSFHIQDVINSMEVSKLLEKYSDTNHVGFKIWHLNDGQLVYGPYEPTVFKLELTDGATSA
nr:phage major capsid protein [Bacillus subtilis]